MKENILCHGLGCPCSACEKRYGSAPIPFVTRFFDFFFKVRTPKAKIVSRIPGHKPKQYEVYKKGT